MKQECIPVGMRALTVFLYGGRSASLVEGGGLTIPSRPGTYQPLRPGTYPHTRHLLCPPPNWGQNDTRLWKITFPHTTHVVGKYAFKTYLNPTQTFTSVS